MKKWIRNLELSILFVTCGIVLTGCNNDLSEYYDNPGVVVQERIDANRNLLSSLYTSGLLDDETYKTLENSLNNNTKRLQKQMSSDSGDVPEDLRSACRWMVTDGDRCGTLAEDKIEDGKLKYPKLNAYNGAKSAIKDKLKPNENATAFALFSEKDESLFKNMLGMKIYVLNSDSIGTDISNISAACEKIKSGEFKDDNEKKACYSVLLKYFKDSGQTILSDNDKLIKESESYKEAEDANSVKGPANVMGKDLVLYSDGFATTSFKVRELNKETIDKLIGDGAFSKDKFLQIKADDILGTTNALYLMEYPVSYIDSVSYDKTSKKATVNVKNSDTIKVNIMSGEVVNIHGTDVLDKDAKAAMEKLLNVTPSTSDGQSSFILWNKATNVVFPDGKYTDSNGNDVSKDSISISPTGESTYNGAAVTIGGKSAETNSILLRDYLELNYMPGVVSDEENYVALGRRLRISDLNSDGTVKDIEKPFAKFVNKDGVAVDGGSVMITDLIDTSSGNSDNPKKCIKLAVYDDVGEQELSNSSGGSGFTLDKVENTFDKVEFKDKISVTMQFPVNDSTTGNKIAVDDSSYNFGPESRGIYYGMATDVNIFTSNLYSGWINIASAENGGLKWWNSWLESNKYNYRINENNLLSYLGLNFNAEMAKAGSSYIVFNEDTIKNINKDIRQDERVNKATAIRTGFVITGFIVIIYAVLLMSAWVVDISTANSFGMMKGLTGGHCVAVQDDSEIPTVDPSSTKYLTMWSTMIRSIVIIAIGIIIIKVDILSLAGGVFNAFKGLGTEFFDKLFNLR